MPGLSRKETNRLLEHIEPQGVRITPTKNGQLLRLPDGSSTVVHYSVSDHRGPQKLKSQLKRAGVTWPTDKNLEHTSKRRPLPRTRDLLDPAMRALGNPARVKVGEIRAQLPPDSTLTPGAIRNYMLWRGYEQRGKTSGASWVLPDVPPFADAIPDPEPQQVVSSPPHSRELTIVPETTSETIAEDETITIEIVGKVPEDVPIPDALPDDAHPGREFIDSVSSWTMHLDTLPEGTTIENLRAFFAAAGLNHEIRVWRA